VRQNHQPQPCSSSGMTSPTCGTSWIPIRDAVARVRDVARPTDQLDATVNSLPIKMGGRGIPSYKTIAPDAYAAASEAADLTLSPGPHTRISPGQHSTPHQTPTLLGDLCGEQGSTAGVAVPRAGQSHNRDILQAGQGVAHHQNFLGVGAAQQLHTLAGEREVHCTHCGEVNFFGHPRGLLPDGVLAIYPT
jgi:hypothetical protein